MKLGVNRIALLFLVIFSSQLLAQEFRVWTDQSGRTMKGSLVTFSGEKVVIEGVTGSFHAFSLSFFSDQDQQYLEAQKKFLSKGNPYKEEHLFLRGVLLVVSVSGYAKINDFEEDNASLDYSYREKTNRDSNSSIPVQVGQIIPSESIITVGMDSEVILLFSNGLITTLGAKSRLVIRKFLQQGFDSSDMKFSETEDEVSPSKLLLDLNVGELVVDVKKLRKKSNFEISTPLGVAGIRGTQFRLVVDEDSTELSVLEGKVDFDSKEKKGLSFETGKKYLVQKDMKSSVGEFDAAQKISMRKAVEKGREKSTDIKLSTLSEKLSANFYEVPSASDMKMIWVKPGSFNRLSGRQEVFLTEGFYLGKYEVTQKEYFSVSKANSESPRGSNPMVVDWSSAMRFCEKLTALEEAQWRLKKGWKYTLPTEAEWEYACRAGSTSYYWWGNQNDNDEIRKRNITAVGLHPPNPWGFHDMHGNISEWCSDRARELPKIATLLNPTGPKSELSNLSTTVSGQKYGRKRVFKGGSSSTRRFALVQSSLGFRVVLKKNPED